MSEVILVQPKVGLLDNIKSAPALPLSLLTAAKFVAPKYKVKLIDQRLDPNWKETLRNELKDSPICVGTTAMLGPPVEHALAVGEVVKEVSDVPVVFGGPTASVLPKQVLETGKFDAVVVGDGEESFPELIDALANKKSLAEVRGLYIKRPTPSRHSEFISESSRNENGKILKSTSAKASADRRVQDDDTALHDDSIVFTGQRPLFDLNKSPDVPYGIVNVGHYLPKREGRPAIDMETSRGCPYNCRFCYNPTFNRRRWRALDSSLALDRVRRVRDEFGVHAVWFVDDEFFIDLDRARKIIEGMTKLGMQWEIQGATIRSLNQMDENYLRMLERSGCKQLNIGAESGSDRILEAVEKGATTEEIIAANRKLRKFNIMPWYYFMIGFPDETEGDRQATVDLVLQLLSENPKAKVSGIGCFTPYPGTSLFEDALAAGFRPPRELGDWKNFGVDYINVPWLTGETRGRVEAIQFASFFLDDKARDIAGRWWIKVLGKLYQPLARGRLKLHFYGLPLDVKVGNMIKKQVARRRVC